MKNFKVSLLLELIDRVSGPLKRPTQQLEVLERQAQRTDSAMERLMTGGKFVAAGAAMVAPLILSFNAASNLNEALNKNQVVFGQHARAVQRWASTSSAAMGIARTDALETVGTFGNLFTSMGLGRGRAAGLSMDIVQLGSDLASFNNTSPTDALDALRSGLVGEIEPLRRYGVNLSATAVAQKAFAMGLTPKVMNATDINPATKALATYQIILDQTKNAQGDFLRTADGAANVLRSIRGGVSDLAGRIGQQLFPVFNPLLIGFRNLLFAANRFAEANPLLTRVLALTTLGVAALLAIIGFGIITLATFTLATAQARIGLFQMQAAAGRTGVAVTGLLNSLAAKSSLGPMLDTAQLEGGMGRLTQLRAVLGGVRVSLLQGARAALTFTASLLTNPVFLLIAALVALGAGFVYAWRKSEDFRAGVMRGLSPITRAWAGLKDDVAALGQTFAPLGQAFSRVTHAMGLDLSKLMGPLDALGYAFGFFIGFVGTAMAITFGRTISFLVTGFGGLVQTVNGLITAAQGLVSLDFTKMNTGLAQARGGLEQILLSPLELAGIDSKQFRDDLNSAGGKARAWQRQVGTWLGVPASVPAPDTQPFAFGLNTAMWVAEGWGVGTRAWIGQKFETVKANTGSLLDSLTSASTEGKPIWQSLLDKVTAPFSLPGVNRRKNFVPSLEGAATAGANLWATVKEKFPGFALPALNRARNFVSSLTGAETAGGDAWGRIKGLFAGFALPGLNRQASFVPSLAGAEAAGGDAWDNIKKQFPAFSLPWLHHAVFKRSLTKANDEGTPIWQSVVGVLTAPFSLARGKRADFDKSLTAAEGSGSSIWSRILGLFLPFDLPGVGAKPFQTALWSAEGTGKRVWGRVTDLLNVVIPIPGVDWSAVQTTLTGMLDHITNFGPQLLTAGEGLIGNLITGIQGKLADLTAVFDNINLTNWVPGVNREDKAAGGAGVKAATQTNPTANLTGIANRPATPTGMKLPVVSALSTASPVPAVAGNFMQSLGAVDPASELGQLLALGFANGILNNQDVARYAARSMAAGTINEVKQKLQIRSPSRVFTNLGGYIPQGLQRGIVGQRGLVTGAMRTLAAAALAVPISPSLEGAMLEPPTIPAPPAIGRSATEAPQGERERGPGGARAAQPGAKTFSFPGATFNLDMSQISSREDFLGKLEGLFEWFGEDTE